MPTKHVKLSVHVPLSHAESIRKVLGKSGAGKAGEYSFCSFSTRGIGRFKPSMQANPAIGEQGVLESVEEENIEVIVPRETLTHVIKEMKKAHPYEEVAYEVIALEDI